MATLLIICCGACISCSKLEGGELMFFITLGDETGAELTAGDMAESGVFCPGGLYASFPCGDIEAATG